jgi:hypothetical protein
MPLGGLVVIALEQSGSQSRHRLLVSRMTAETTGLRRLTLSSALFVAGSVAIPVGLVFLGFGYWGVAHTTFVFDQLPYLASGGLIGLALVVLGGFLYFGHWQVLALEERRQQSRLQTDENRALLERLDRVHEALLALSETGRARSAVGTADYLVTTASGRFAHQPDCRLVEGKTDVRRLSPEDAAALPACQICSP